MTDDLEIPAFLKRNKGSTMPHIEHTQPPEQTPVKPTREHLIMAARGLQEQIAKADARIRHEQQERSKLVKLHKKAVDAVSRFDIDNGGVG